MNQKPVAVGLLLCEQVIVEEKTRNVTAVNCFSRRIVERFPAGPFPFVLFATMTDGIGDMPVRVLIESLDTLDHIFRRTLMVRFTDPLQEVRYLLRIRNCVFPRPCSYQISLFVDDDLVALKKFSILAKETSS